MPQLRRVSLLVIGLFWLIFTLAVYALPFFVAINAAIWALQAALACSARR